MDKKDKIDWKKRYIKLKKEFEDYKFTNVMTKEDLIKYIISMLKIPKDSGLDLSLFKLSYSDLNELVYYIRGFIEK